MATARSRRRAQHVVVEHCGSASLPARLVARLATPLLRPTGRVIDVALTRRTAGLLGMLDYPAAILPRPRGTTLRPVRLTDCGAEWVIGAQAVEGPGAGGAVLYFHGGAFVTCGIRTHRPLAARISNASGLPVLNVAYRQLPEVPIATSVADALDAYRWLLDHGYRQVVLAGDSAGGYLAFAVAVAAARAGLPRPAGIVALSPGVGVPGDDPDRFRFAAQDPLGAPMSGLLRAIDRLDPLAFAPELAPFGADLSGLPPTLIQCGSTELLRYDAELMAQRLAAAGVPCRLQLWDRQIHVFQAGADVLPEARQAIAHIGEFIRDVTAAAPAAEATA